MRLVHTSDWHAGRRWRGVDRLDELNAVLDHLAGWLVEHEADVLLMTGDVFDNGAPSAAAERCVFDFFRKVGRAGIQTVVIAGNHDNGKRLEAWGRLTELVGVDVVGRPRRADAGGVRTLTTRGGQACVVAALPFAGPRELVSALQLAESDGDARGLYADRMAAFFRHLTRGFRADAVNVLMAHTHLEGAVFNGSERAVHVGDEWAAMPQQLPPGASYVALGHIHKPQMVVGAPVPAYYAGSPLQMDFGEAGEDKSFVVIDAEPGLPARVRREPYVGAKPLQDLQLSLEAIEAEQSQLQDAGWLRVTVPLAAPDPDLGSRVRRLLPNALVVRAELPDVEPEVDPDRPGPDASPSELYGAFFKRRHGETPPDVVLATFRRLYEQHS